MENKGNPYHDESGKFTSKEGQGSGSASESKKSSDPLMDLYRGLMESLTGGNNKSESTKKKFYPSTLDGEILDEEGIEAESEEEAMKIAAEKFPGHGDELMVFADDEDESQPDYEDSKEEAMKMFGLDKKEEPKKYTDEKYEINSDGSITFKDVAVGERHYPSSLWSPEEVEEVRDDVNVPAGQLMINLLEQTNLGNDLNEEEYKNLYNRASKEDVSAEEVEKYMGKYMGELAKTNFFKDWWKYEHKVDDED